MKKMEDVPFPIGEDWEWIDCYKALYKTYYLSNDKVVDKLERVC